MIETKLIMMDEAAGDIHVKLFYELRGLLSQFAVDNVSEMKKISPKWAAAWNNLLIQMVIEFQMGALAEESKDNRREEIKRTLHDSIEMYLDAWFLQYDQQKAKKEGKLN